MVSLESPSQAPPAPAHAGPLSPALSAFLAEYIEAKSDLLATARKLQISFEAALDLLADPALQSKLAALDESNKRAAREAAVQGVQHAMSVLATIATASAAPYEVNQRAASNLFRASIWLVRIAEGKVSPDRLPDRFRRRDPEHAPKGESPSRFDAAVGAPASPFSTRPLESPTLATCMQPAPEQSDKGGRSAALHTQPSPTNLHAHRASSNTPPNATSSAAERRYDVARGGSPGLATPQTSEPRRGDISPALPTNLEAHSPTGACASISPSPAPTGPRNVAMGGARASRAQPVEAGDQISPAPAGAEESQSQPRLHPQPPGRETTPRASRSPNSLISRAGAADSS